jgi:hypothetical protein
MRLPKRGGKKKSECTNLRRKSRNWKDNRKNWPRRWKILRLYTPGGRATAINRDLSTVAHDLARLTAEWESVTALTTGKSRELIVEC